MRRPSLARCAQWMLLACCCATPALGNGVIRDGVGAISIGRGGTNIAFSDNTVVLLDNPAGMMGMNGQSMFQLGLDGLLTDLYYEDPARADRAAFRPMGLPQFGYMRLSEDEIWAWGFAVAIPAGFGTHFQLEHPVFGSEVYSSFASLVKVLPGVACQVTENLSVGATLGVGISYANLDGPFFVQQGPVPPAGTRAMLDVQGAGATPIWSIGMQYTLSDATTLGIAYQSESRFHLHGNAQVGVPGLPGLADNYDAELDLTWPSTLGIGLAHWLDDRQRVSADVIWVQWSNAFDTIGLDLSNGSGPLGLPPAFSDQFPFRWRDSISVRLGYEKFVTLGTVVRVGYIYNSNQVPDGTLTPYVPAILEHAVSVGAGWMWSDWAVDIAYQYGFGPDRTVAQSELAGNDFDNSLFQAQAHWLGVALTRQF